MKFCEYDAMRKWLITLSGDFFLCCSLLSMLQNGFLLYASFKLFFFARGIYFIFLYFHWLIFLPYFFYSQLFIIIILICKLKFLKKKNEKETDEIFIKNFSLFVNECKREWKAWMKKVSCEFASWLKIINITRCLDESFKSRIFLSWYTSRKKLVWCFKNLINNEFRGKL